MKQKYRTKSVEIEAEIFEATGEQIKRFMLDYEPEKINQSPYCDEPECYNSRIPYGMINLCVGDYIVTGKSGEPKNYKPKHFFSIYERIE